MSKVLRALSFAAILLCPALAFAQSHSATLSWTPATQSNGITIASWNVLRGATSGGPYTQIANIPVAITSYTDTSVSSGQNYFYVVYAMDTNGTASVDSTEAEAIIPNSAPPLAVATTSLPPAITGTIYSVTITASGGTGPYTWSGTGVDALTFSGTGLLSGMPSQEGTFTQIVTVRDSASAPASASFPLSVARALAQPPSVVSVTPGSGSGLGPQTFSYLYSDASGYQNISVVETVLNTAPKFSGSCGTEFQPATSTLYLIKDDGNGWLGPLTIGQPGTLQNGQCTLDAGASSASGSGTNLTVNLALTFQPTFFGMKNNFMLATDTVNNLTSGLQNRGTWTPRQVTVAAADDFDGDGKSDNAVFRPSTGQWFIIQSSNPGTPIVQSWGLDGDVPVPGDYDGDGKTDFAVWRPSTGQWFIIPSNNPGSLIVQQWGASGDIPVSGDYDGDGKTDFAVWRPSNGTWYVIPSSNPGSLIVQQWGASGDIPVSEDYDGDGKTDFAVWRPSNGTWYVIPSSNPSNFLVQQWGVNNDQPVPGDYDGDGKADFAVWRPSNGTWYVIPSSNPSNFLVQQWGVNNDQPVPGDYDGDGKTDFAVWRPSNGTWYVIPSSAPTNYAVTQWGVSTDVPVQKPLKQ